MLARRKTALRRMIDVMGTDITYNGEPIRALVKRHVADQPYSRIDIIVHVDDISGDPAYQAPVVIDGTVYKVLNEGTTRPRGGGDRWMIPLGAGESASDAKLRKGRI